MTKLCFGALHCPHSTTDVHLFARLHATDSIANNVTFKNCLKSIYKTYCQCKIDFNIYPSLKFWPLIWDQITTAAHESSPGVLFPHHVLHLIVEDTGGYIPWLGYIISCTCSGSFPGSHPGLMSSEYFLRECVV